MPVGDLDGDGRGDVALVYGDGSYVHVAVYLGREAWPEALSIDDADVRFLNAGLRTPDLPTAATVGDLDGDGLGDLLLSQRYEEVGEHREAGAIRVFLGRADWPAELAFEEADATFVGGDDWANLGEAGTVVLEDLDGDGRDDLVAGTPSEPSPGGVYVFFGRCR
ncbi:MAG: hypothetical protein ACOZNI_20480 [Myxococcota bacterium]